MLEHEDAPFAQQIAAQDHLHHPLAALQIVGRVGKDHVELLGAAAQVEKDIGLHGKEVGDAQLAPCGG